jgi:hypothetical protein
MATDVKIRFRSFLPGGGFDSSGNAKQGKTRVVGEVDVTSYDGGEGEPLKPVDVGLNAIDAITLRNAEEISGGLSGGDASRRGVVYAKGSGHFYLFTTDGAGTITPLASGGTETIEFVAEGDSAHDVELT